MGFYINPHDMSKEDWLKEYGTLAVRITEAGFKHRPENTLPVILVDNGPFTAAAIAYNEQEYQEFINPKDIRPKTLYFVQLDELLAVLPDLQKGLDWEKEDMEKGA